MNFDEISLQTAQLSPSLKWNRYGRDVIPSWIADMDFPVAKPIQTCLYDLASHGDLCYVPEPPLDPIYEVFAERMSEKFNWCPDPENMECLSDIVQGIYIAAKVLCEDDEQIIIDAPTYHPILNACRDMKRQIVFNPLVKTNDGWQVDFDQLEENITEKTRMLMLVNPHNPSGKVYTRVELERYAEIVLKHNLYVVADEIHCDLVCSESVQHIPFATLGPEVAKRTVTFNSATKSHNLGAIRFAIAHHGSRKTKERFDLLPGGIRGGLNALGPRVTRIAWQQCDDWLESVVGYLRSNRDYLSEFLSNNLSEIRHIPNQATYLAWLDLSRCGLGENPADKLLSEGRVGCYSGNIFGKGGEGHIRLNFATSKSILHEKLTRIKNVIHSYR